MKISFTSHKSALPCGPLDELDAVPRSLPPKFRGVAASFGIVEGPCTVIRNLEDLYTIRPGAILVFEKASPELGLVMPFLSGLATEQGGFMAFASGYAREYAIPAVVGVKGLMDYIHDGDVIRVDGSTGTVDIIDRS